MEAIVEKAFGLWKKAQPRFKPQAYGGMSGI
jgi:hypothetical protein